MTEKLAVRLTGIARAMRAVLGVPDYERYVAHMLEDHPGCQPMSRDQFAHERLESRYSKPGAKCC